jgi:hypothetical protein
LGEDFSQHAQNKPVRECRLVVHHVLTRCGFAPPGAVFAVSAVFLQRIERYREVLVSSDIRN